MIATEHGVSLRPHVKTHKTVEITKLQLATGAHGITVSKPSEAMKFFHSGIKELKSVLLAYPIVQAAKLTKLLIAAQQFHMDFLLTIDRYTYNVIH
jgi:D-serine deaminase-like pyridoxal phosphate-dependent protein